MLGEIIRENRKKMGLLLNVALDHLLSFHEEIVKHAADSLYGYYMRNEDYDEAEKYLSYFPKEDPLSKNKQADICVKKGQTYEAYKLKEEILFSQYQVISQVMHSLYMMSLEKGKEDADDQKNKLK